VRPQPATFGPAVSAAILQHFAFFRHTHVNVHLHLHLHLRAHFHGPALNYVAIGLGSAASWLGLPGPGEALLVAAGIAGSRHHAPVGGAMFVGWSGAMAGSFAGWAVGRKVGRPLLEAQGPLHAARRRVLASGERVYDRHPLLAVIIAPPMLAGINRMSARRFLVITAPAALAWAIGLTLGGEAAGPAVLDLVGDAGTVGAVALGLAVAWEILRRRRRVGRRHDLSGPPPSGPDPPVRTKA
jgi:membrane protein DedA with SNARE-associated domain